MSSCSAFGWMFILIHVVNERQHQSCQILTGEDYQVTEALRLCHHFPQLLIFLPSNLLVCRCYLIFV